MSKTSINANLENLAKASPGSERFPFALGLADLVMEAMNDDEYTQWGRDHGWVDESGAWDCAHPRGAAA